ncbi:hypothetical protein G2W53_011633 [Senna tora]|uniref:Uncharacterized protein n=1 Tax=Senna tora TaxID=362788 RepID=A0A835CBE6_9FABA|nr:hypothetical protein G2W53_011633 [Senna tora]
MFSNITLKIIDAGKALFPSIRGKEVNIFKETLEICYNFFTWFFGIIFTLKITDSGKAFYAENHSVMMAVVLIKFVYFLILVLGTLSEMYTRNLDLRNDPRKNEELDSNRNPENRMNTSSL